MGISFIFKEYKKEIGKWKMEFMEMERQEMGIQGNKYKSFHFYIG